MIRFNYFTTEVKKKTLATKSKYDMKKLPKIALFGILVQSAGLIYGIVNKAEDIIIMCLIFMFVSCLPLFDKKK